MVPRMLPRKPLTLAREGFMSSVPLYLRKLAPRKSKPVGCRSLFALEFLMVTYADSRGFLDVGLGVVSSGRDRLGAQDGPVLRHEESSEVLPLPVDQDAAHEQDRLHPVAAPSHARTVEADADEMPDSSLDDAAADVQVLPPQRVIAHTVGVLREVRDGLVEDRAAVLVAGPRARRCGEDRAKLVDHVLELTAAQALLLRGDPGFELLASLAVQRLAGLPQLFDDVVPVQAHLDVGEELLLEIPQRFGAVGHEEDLGELRSPVAALLGFAQQPFEEGAVALEGAIDTLVDRPFEPARCLPERVQHADGRHLGVLRLLSGGAARTRRLAATLPPFMALRTGRTALRSPMGLPTPRVLAARDCGRALAVHRDDEHVAVVFGRRGVIKEGSRFGTHPIHHAQRRSLTRTPFEDIAERRACPAEGHLRAQLHQRRDHEEAEATAQTQFPIEGQVASRTLPADQATDGALVLDLAEARAHLARLGPGDLVRATLVLVSARSRTRGAAGDPERHQRAPDRQHRGPQRRLEHRERTGLPLVGLPERRVERGLDVSPLLVDTRRHRGPLLADCRRSQRDYPRREGRRLCASRQEPRGAPLDHACKPGTAPKPLLPST